MNIERIFKKDESGYIIFAKEDESRFIYLIDGDKGLSINNEMVNNENINSFGVEIEPYSAYIEFVDEINKPTEEQQKLFRINDLKSYLKDTDWYVAREFETDVPMPEDVRVKREQARAEINELQK